MRHLLATLLLQLCIQWACTSVQATPVNLSAHKRILFLGDSITHAGHYVSYLECQLRQDGGPMPELIQIGLPSETCSGLSEPEHPWPRPNVHERLKRALRKTDPDLVFACYGMNDGIYHPFSETRFAAFEKGLETLIAEVDRHGAKLILLTPPPFDPIQLKGTPKLRPLGARSYAWFAIYEGYDDVLKKYARHILGQERDPRVLATVDLHTAVTEAFNRQRRTTPGFSFHPDGVHLDAGGHKVMADAILRRLGTADPSKDPDEALYQLVHKRQTLLHYSWLTHVGHKRPNTKAGIPLPQAKKQAEILEKNIQKHLESATKRKP